MNLQRLKDEGYTDEQISKAISLALNDLANMTFTEGTLVRVKDKAGNFVTTSIHSNLGALEVEQYYWINVNNDWTIVSKSDLITWNSSDCECGADKLRHPGHSHWCPKWSVI